MAAPGEGDRRQSSSRYCPISLLRGCRLDPLLLQRLPHALRDDGRIVVDGERHGTLEPMRPGDEAPVPAIERLGGDPCFVRAARVPATSDDGCLDALATGTGYTFDVENRERHKASL